MKIHIDKQRTLLRSLKILVMLLILLWTTGIFLPMAYHQFEMDHQISQLTHDHASQLSKYLASVGKHGDLPSNADIATFADFLKTILREHLSSENRKLALLWAVGTVLILSIAFFVRRRFVEMEQLKSKLRKSEEMYRLLFDHAGDYILLLAWEDDRGPIIIDANKAALKTLGYNLEDMIGKHVIELLDVTEYKESSKLLSQKLHKPGDSLRFEANHKRQDGSMFTVEVNATLVRVGNDPPFLISIERDITERKKMEDLLQANKELLGQAVHVANIGIFYYKQVEDDLYWSPKQREIHGWGADEPVTMSDFYELIHPQDREEIAAAIQRAKDPHSNGLWDVEHRIIRRDGTIRWLIGRSQTFFEGEGDARHPVRTVGAVQDITERRRLEAERRRLSERLHRTEKMEALGTMAGGVAHDLNNVLGALFAYSELLLHKMPAADPLRSYVEKILASGKQAAVIIKDLLNLTRRGIVDVVEVIKINDLIVNFLNTPVNLELSASHPDVMVRLELAQDVLNIKGSAAHLEKVLMNLLANAVEAISGRGEVILKTINRYLDKPIQGYDAVAEGEYVVLSVTDTGGGIADADRDRIFEPFYTKKKMGRSGTGLGLAIVWGTVKDHAGYIDVETQMGKGTTFSLYFPATREGVSQRSEAIPVADYRGNGEKILIVDDVPEQREIAVKLLTALGYQTHTVSSGESAVDYLQTNDVDLLLLDMIMEPGIDGLETYRRIIEIKPGQKTIIVSGYSETNRVAMMQKLGAGPYVQKPYIMETIGLAIKGELNQGLT